MRSGLLIALALLTAGCATSIEPTEADLRADWESKNIPPRDYKGDILAFMRTYLNDPRNVRSAAVSPPERKRLPGDPGDRFVSCVRYNAKKSDTVYGGVKTGVAVYASGKLDRFVDTPVIARDLCKDATLSPFPELEKLTR